MHEGVLFREEIPGYASLAEEDIGQDQIQALYAFFCTFDVNCRFVVALGHAEVFQ